MVMLTSNMVFICIYIYCIYNYSYIAYIYILYIYIYCIYIYILYIHIYIYMYCKWGLYGDTVLIPPVVFQGTVRQRHVGSRPHSSIEKSAFLCNARLKRWKQYARLRTQLAKRHIRNRDNSVHRLSAVRALNFHRKRSTCVLLTSVGCERS